MRLGFDPLVRKILWGRKRQPTPVFLSGESPWTEEPGSLLCPWGHKESDTTEQLTHTSWGVPRPTLVGKMPWKPRYHMVPCKQQPLSAVLPQGSHHDAPLGSLPATPSHIPALHSQVTFFQVFSEHQPALPDPV